MYMTENFQQDIEDLNFIRTLITSPPHTQNTIEQQQLPPYHPNGEPGQTSRPGPSISIPRRRAEAWNTEETRTLINLRREKESLFNTSKSNKHLWESISVEMRERGFERSPNMCTNKWKNLVKEFKKAKKNNNDAKMRNFKEIEAILKEKSKNVPPCGGIDKANGSFGPGEGDRSNTHRKVITVKHGNISRKIGINGTPDAIKETIETAFRLRRKRPFILEDESNVIHTIDRDMPLGQYTLHFDEGVTIRVRSHVEEDHLEELVETKTFYSEEDFHRYLSCHGWSCLKECHRHRTVDNVDELIPGAMYRGGKSTSL